MILFCLKVYIIGMFLKCTQSPLFVHLQHHVSLSQNKGL